jgi:hypothetical protein
MDPSPEDTEAKTVGLRAADLVLYVLPGTKESAMHRLEAKIALV